MRATKISEHAELVISLDDFHPANEDIARRILELGFVPTFFIETVTPGALKQIERLHALGCEIGSHTMSHPPDIKALSSEEIRSELSVSKNQIERITGKPCETLAYPRGRFNEDVIEAAKVAGYKEARTTHVLKTDRPEDPFRTPTTIHVYDGRKEYGGRPWRVMADFYLDHVMKAGGVFHIWGHARELERDGQIEPLLEFLKKAPPHTI